MATRETKLTRSDKAALRWAADKADEWYGNVTGDEKRENEHLRRMDKVQDALLKIGVKIKRQQAGYPNGPRFRVKLALGRRY